MLSDFLLVILRSLATRRRDFRLVAMSATVDAELFQRYFEAEVPGTCGCIEIPGRTFPVAEYRLEDAIEATGYVVDPDGEYAAGSEANFNARGVAGGSRRTFNPLSGGVGGTGGGGGGGGIIDGVNGAEDDVSEDVPSAAEGNDALTRSGPSKFPERVTTGAPSSFSVLFPNSSQALNPVLCMVTSLYSRSVVPGGSSTRPVQMFPSVHLSRNPSSGSHAPNTSASPTTPTCRP